MKKLTSFIFLFLGLTLSLSAQQPVKNYYHSTQNKVELKESKLTTSKAIKTLNKYDNVIVLNDSIDDNWYYVKFANSEGFIQKNLVKEGKAIVSNNTYRIGATCKDGTSSSATGRGACSHHGGVARWRTTTKKSVYIQSN